MWSMQFTAKLSIFNLRVFLNLVLFFKGLQVSPKNGSHFCYGWPMLGCEKRWAFSDPFMTRLGNGIFLFLLWNVEI